MEGLGEVGGRGLLKSTTTTMDGMDETYFKPDNTFKGVEGPRLRSSLRSEQL